MRQNGKEWQQIYCWQVSYQHNGNYQVISSKYLYTCKKVSSLDNFIILQNQAILDLWSDQGFFQRNQLQKLVVLHWERKGEKKHQVTWAQKYMTK